MSTTTINNKWLAHLKSVLTWAFANDYIPDNPAQGVRVSEGKSDAEPSRVPFTADEITAILQSEPFKGELGERQWAVLVGLYSGMRASEVAQLRVDGVRPERGVLVFSVDGELKNAGSRRLVPVHPELKARGPDALIAKRKAEGHAHLFPEWFARGQAIIAAAQRRGKSVQQPYANVHPKWFNRYLLPALNIDSARKSFHAPCHTFKTGLSMAGVSREISDALTGHVDRSAGGRYVHGASIEACYEAIKLLQLSSC